MKVTVVMALPRRQWLRVLELEEGATVADALEASGLAASFPGLDLATLRTGIWNKPCRPDTRLRDNDRVELYRPVSADARQMRRARVAATTSRRARSAR